MAIWGVILDRPRHAAALVPGITDLELPAWNYRLGIVDLALPRHSTNKFNKLGLCVQIYGVWMQGIFDYAKKSTAGAAVISQRAASW